MTKLTDSFFDLCSANMKVGFSFLRWGFELFTPQKEKDAKSAQVIILSKSSELAEVANAEEPPVKLKAIGRRFDVR